MSSSSRASSDVPRNGVSTRRLMTGNLSCILTRSHKPAISTRVIRRSAPGLFTGKTINIGDWSEAKALNEARDESYVLAAGSTSTGRELGALGSKKGLCVSGSGSSEPPIERYTSQSFADSRQRSIGVSEYHSASSSPTSCSAEIIVSLTSNQRIDLRRLQ